MSTAMSFAGQLGGRDALRADDVLRRLDTVVGAVVSLAAYAAIGLAFRRYSGLEVIA